MVHNEGWKRTHELRTLPPHTIKPPIKQMQERFGRTKQNIAWSHHLKSNTLSHLSLPHFVNLTLSLSHSVSLPLDFPRD